MKKFILFIDRELPNPYNNEQSSNFYKYIFCYIDVLNKKLLPIDLKILRVIVNYEQKKHILISEERYKNALNELSQSIGEEVKESLIKGQCEILSIIDSPGGHGGYAKDIQRCITFFGSLGAITRAYIFTQAASAAFIIASAFDEKYSLLGTEFMFHRGGIPEDAFNENSENVTEVNLEHSGEVKENTELDSESDQETEYENLDEIDTQELNDEIDRTEMNYLLNLFFSKCDNDKKEECSLLIDLCLENLNADIYFSGEHLLRLGILNDCPLTTKELIEKCVNDIGVPLGPESSLFKLFKEFEISCDELAKSGIFKMSDGLFSDIKSPYIYTNTNGSNT